MYLKFVHHKKRKEKEKKTRFLIFFGELEVYPWLKIQAPFKIKWLATESYLLLWLCVIKLNLIAGV